MDVVSNCPAALASIALAGAGAGAGALAVIDQGHVSPEPGRPARWPPSRKIRTSEENHWDDDPRREPLFAQRPRPVQARAGGLLVGNAFAPRGEPVSRLVARLIVGNVDKSVVIHGERSFSQDGALRPGTRFRRMPLRYERAAGGPGTTQPRGRDPRDGHARRGAPPQPGAAGPQRDAPRRVHRAGGLRAHRRRLARAARAARPQRRVVDRERWRPSPIPEWLDQRFFMSSPADQYLDELRPNERIVLEKPRTPTTCGS